MFMRNYIFTMYLIKDNFEDFLETKMEIIMSIIIYSCIGTHKEKI